MGSGSVIAYYVISFIVVAIGAYASYKAASSVEADDSYKNAMDEGLRVNTRSTTEPIKVVYGRGRIGGNDIYFKEAGADNKDFWVVQTLCEGPIDSVEEAYLGNLTDADYEAQYLSWWLKEGTGSQVVEPNLNAISSEWTDPLHYTAYIIWKLTWDQDVYQGLPKRQSLVKGRLLYDPRDDTTAWSDNAVLAVWDWLTNGRYGMGINAGKLDVDSFNAAASYCEAKGWTINMVISRADRKQSVLNKILALFRGTLQWYDGKLYLRYADLAYESVVMTIEDKHIARDSSGKALITMSQPSKLQKADGLNVLYTEPLKEYTVDGMIIGDALGKVDDYQLLACNNRAQAAYLGYYMLERQKLDRTITIPTRDDCIKLEPHDLVALESTALSLSEPYMRVVSSSIRQDGVIDLTLQYEDEALYNDQYDIDLENIYSVTLPDPTDEPPGVTNVTMTEEVYSYRMRSESRFLITFTAPNYVWFSHVEVWQSFDNANWIFLFNVVDDFQVGPLEEGQKYYIKLKVVSIRGTKQTDNNAWVESKLATGQSSARPPSLTYLHYVLSRNNGLSLFSQKIYDDDIEVYEFRLGTSWSGGVFLASLRSPNLVFNMVKPGVHTIFCNTLGTNGLYGANPVSVQVTLPDPPDDYTVITTRSFNNLVTNGDMELDSNWEDFSYAPTVNIQSSQQRHGENFSRKFTVDAQWSGIRSDPFTTINGGKYSVGLFVFPEGTLTTVDVLLKHGDNSSHYHRQITGLAPNVWNEITLNWTEGGVSGGAGAYVAVISQAGATSGTWFVDDVCVLEGDFADNMNPVLYGGDAYIKCSHNNSVMSGSWLSPVLDLGAPDTYLVYSLNDIAIVGQGALWKDQMPNPVTWRQVGVTTKKWREIFELSAAPKVEMSLNYGPDGSVINDVARLEILGGIINLRYYQFKIDIEDPQIEVYAYVEGPNIKFTQ